MDEKYFDIKAVTPEGETKYFGFFDTEGRTKGDIIRRVAAENGVTVINITMEPVCACDLCGSQD